MSDWSKSREDYEDRLEARLRNSEPSNIRNEESAKPLEAPTLFYKENGRIFLARADNDASFKPVRIDSPLILDLNRDDVIAAQIAAGIAKEGAMIQSSGLYFKFNAGQNRWEQHKLPSKPKPFQLPLDLNYEV